MHRDRHSLDFDYIQIHLQSHFDINSHRAHHNFGESHSTMCQFFCFRLIILVISLAGKRYRLVDCWSVDVNDFHFPRRERLPGNQLSRKNDFYLLFPIFILFPRKSLRATQRSKALLILYNFQPFCFLKFISTAPLEQQHTATTCSARQEIILCWFFFLLSLAWGTATNEIMTVFAIAGNV